MWGRELGFIMDAATPLFSKHISRSARISKRSFPIAVLFIMVQSLLDTFYELLEFIYTYVQTIKQEPRTMVLGYDYVAP